MPLELYPPTINLIRHLADTGRWEIDVHTSANVHGLADFSYPGVQVHRSPSPVGSALHRLTSYVRFHLGTPVSLATRRPDLVMYFEPQSSFPVFAARLAGSRPPLFVHHHEYYEPQEFLAPGMRLPRLFHKIEQARLFPKASWISHTNEERARLFEADTSGVTAGVTRILPNLPPSSWTGTAARVSRTASGPIRFVYVGSLSLRHTYIGQLVEWIAAQPAESVALDVYSYNTDAATKTFLLESAGDRIRFFPEGVPYDSLPSLLPQYDIGLILYKAENANFQHNASNKLFEYLACGLDVVFPDTMREVMKYAGENVTPRIMPVSFDTGEGLSVERFQRRSGLKKRESDYRAETVLDNLEQSMLRAVESADRE
jgi:hypothetical protein